jgi:hypothetical protein
LHFKADQGQADRLKNKKASEGEGLALVCLDEWLRNYIYGKVRARFNKDLDT